MVEKILKDKTICSETNLNIFLIKLLFNKTFRSCFNLTYVRSDWLCDNDKQNLQ